MKETVTIKELAAIVIRRGKWMIVLALIFALILGAFELSQQISAMNAPDNTLEAIETRYQDALKEHQEEEERLNKELQKLQRSLQEEQKYYDQSLLMKIDPYNKAVSLINLAITDMEDSTFLQVFQIEGTPVDYIVSRIQNQYLVMWRSVDLQEVLGGDVSDKYLREVVGVKAQSGGLLEIVAYAETEAEAERRASAVYAYLTKSSSVVADSAYPHAFSVLSESTKVDVDLALESTQQAVEDNIENYTSQIEETEMQLEALVPPVRDSQITVGTAAVAVVKYAVLGIVLGIILGVIWAIVSYLFSNKLTFSCHLEHKLSVPMMASMGKRKDLWNRIADWMLDERVWKEEENALDYLTESAEVRLIKGEKIVLLTTLREAVSTREVQIVIDKLEQSGYHVQYVNDAYYNGQALSAIAQNDSVILMERCGCSKMDAIDTVVSLAQEQKKAIKGYILI